MKSTLIVSIFCVCVPLCARVAPGVSTSGVLLPAYRAFFHHVKSPQDASAKANSAEALELQTWHQKHIGLNASEAAFLKQVAIQHVASADSIDQQASQIIQSLHTASGRLLASASGLPGPEAELSQLRKQRDDLTTANIQSLQTNLSSASFLKLDTWVKSNFSQKTSKPKPARPAHTAPRGGVL